MVHDRLGDSAELPGGQTKGELTSTITVYRGPAQGQDCRFLDDSGCSRGEIGYRISVWMLPRSVDAIVGFNPVPSAKWDGIVEEKGHSQP